MIRRPPRSTRKESSAASDVYKRQIIGAQNFAHRINFNECPGCKICVDKCPTDCIKIVEINQSKNDIKEKVKYNFDRRKFRKEGLQKKYEKSIEEQLNKISDAYK